MTFEHNGSLHDIGAMLHRYRALATVIDNIGDEDNDSWERSEKAHEERDLLAQDLTSTLAHCLYGVLERDLDISWHLREALA